ncbi:MAG: hypothetical protein M3Q56_13075 [Bacteroidota bacterium]|nr:hypothetical protein [Bacteroidota bacterium]
MEYIFVPDDGYDNKQDFLAALLVTVENNKLRHHPKLNFALADTQPG